MNIYEREYTRKPTLRIARDEALFAITSPMKYDAVHLSWGENLLEFELYNGQWIGSGWIGSISGQDIADDYNKTISQKLPF